MELFGSLNASLNNSKSRLHLLFTLITSSNLILHINVSVGEKEKIGPTYSNLPFLNVAASLRARFESIRDRTWRGKS
jgi:hypothetical protein